ncbi:hypothetical protein PPERSA_10347 [Pseudocohnilembus persalinus]|uniref:Uncharacterized protein n=1 Tax=Pseudocohnilembus persalinus TaxID=266149 RepID=A0A0V0R086_PSEPJ|nr:hypothetical protein PPERSA_10347 [Pseudocohnilembus persalinus]|eukprot:KRX07959.1 hypothetical protein PPERSA_10347 [Pseudocohnilembus persalinus]
MYQGIFFIFNNQNIKKCYFSKYYFISIFYLQCLLLHNKKIIKKINMKYIQIIYFKNLHQNIFSVTKINKLLSLITNLNIYLLIISQKQNEKFIQIKQQLLYKLI